MGMAGQLLGLALGIQQDRAFLLTPSSSVSALMSCPKAETALLTSQLAWRVWGAITHMLSVLAVP